MALEKDQDELPGSQNVDVTVCESLIERELSQSPQTFEQTITNDSLDDQQNQLNEVVEERERPKEIVQTRDLDRPKERGHPSKKSILLVKACLPRRVQPLVV